MRAASRGGEPYGLESPYKPFNPKIQSTFVVPGQILYEKKNDTQCVHWTPDPSSPGQGSNPFRFKRPQMSPTSEFRAPADNEARLEQTEAPLQGPLLIPASQHPGVARPQHSQKSQNPRILGLVPWLLLSLVSSIQRQHSDHSDHTASPSVRLQGYKS
ncbi:hypothetical protein MG293_000544 [Ovis ammon polii]|uniref:Uncharacterized protein n=1 Tax=Ovis ammon polii TaxID=230172 RepID=A0AAD4YH74_OVIAM|nr:hypothetical protein MG293_000544 [Ovis ammon polii]